MYHNRFKDGTGPGDPGRRRGPFDPETLRRIALSAVIFALLMAGFMVWSGHAHAGGFQFDDGMHKLTADDVAEISQAARGTGMDVVVVIDRAPNEDALDGRIRGYATRGRLVIGVDPAHGYLRVQVGPGLDIQPIDAGRIAQSGLKALGKHHYGTGIARMIVTADKLSLARRPTERPDPYNPPRAAAPPVVEYEAPAPPVEPPPVPVQPLHHAPQTDVPASAPAPAPAPAPVEKKHHSFGTILFFLGLFALLVWFFRKIFGGVEGEPLTLNPRPPSTPPPPTRSPTSVPGPNYEPPIWRSATPIPPVAPVTPVVPAAPAPVAPTPAPTPAAPPSERRAGTIVGSAPSNGRWPTNLAPTLPAADPPPARHQMSTGAAVATGAAVGIVGTLAAEKVLDAERERERERLERATTVPNRSLVERDPGTGASASFTPDPDVTPAPLPPSTGWQTYSSQTDGDFRANTPRPSPLDSVGASASFDPDPPDEPTVVGARASSVGASASFTPDQDDSDDDNDDSPSDGYGASATFAPDDDSSSDDSSDDNDSDS